jgi:hypothetical protein
MNDFSAKTVKALAKKGITLIGLQAIPDMTSSMPWANATRGYVMNDNDCCRVLTFSEVLDLAKAC